MPSRSDLFARTLANREEFERLVTDAGTHRNLNKSAASVLRAADFAVSTGTGVYRSQYLERLLLNMADQLARKKTSTRRGVLHVMTQAYQSGGHTRVVERWINHDSHHCRHSVFLTGQGKLPIPQKIPTLTRASGGQVFRPSRYTSLVSKALTLQKVAQEYDFVVLHTHMQDPIATLALGAQNFAASVIYYNHADHRFSLGMGAASVVAETRSWGKNISSLKRGITESVVLGIPLQKDMAGHYRKNFSTRAKLNISAASKVIFSAASEHKFIPFQEFNFLHAAVKILLQQPTAHLLLVGVGKDFIQRNLMDIDGGEAVCARIHTASAVGEELFINYLMTADLVIDSFPENGSTTLMDCVSCGLPVVSLMAPTGQMDYLVNTREYTPDIEAFIRQVLCLLDNEQWSRRVWQEQHERLMNDSSPVNFSKRLHSLYAQAMSSKPIGLGNRIQAVGLGDIDLLHTARGHI
ncbi:glycosyltransferase [Acetobacter peroxydans]|nr:glycosyltransferase [Acetobacter peroxydans]